MTIPLCEAIATKSSFVQQRTHFSSSPGTFEVKWEQTSHRTIIWRFSNVDRSQIWEQTNWIAMIPDDLIDENEFKGTLLIYPCIVSISKNWSSVNSLTGIMDVILSPSDKDKIWLKRSKRKKKCYLRQLVFQFLCSTVFIKRHN